MLRARLSSIKTGLMLYLIVLEKHSQEDNHPTYENYLYGEGHDLLQSIRKDK